MKLCYETCEWYSRADSDAADMNQDDLARLGGTLHFNFGALEINLVKHECLLVFSSVIVVLTI